MWHAGGQAIQSSACSAPPILPSSHCPQGELDLHKGEANRLRREMERVEGERERLREDARK